LQCSIIRAENPGRQSLVFEKIKDRIEPICEQIEAILETLDPDERTDALHALIDFIEDRTFNP
jgi:hypothetical protein